MFSSIRCYSIFLFLIRRSTPCTTRPDTRSQSVDTGTLHNWAASLADARLVFTNLMASVMFSCDHFRFRGTLGTDDDGAGRRPLFDFFEFRCLRGAVWGVDVVGGGELRKFIGFDVDGMVWKVWHSDCCDSAGVRLICSVVI